jgi:hypothetical protein
MTNTGAATIVAAAVILSLAAVVAVVMAARFVSWQIAAQDREREAWRSERRELLNRIQHPHRMPTGTVSSASLAPPPDPERLHRRAEFNGVGMVRPVAPADDLGDDIP